MSQGSGNSLHFDGNNDRVNLDHHASGCRTIEMWFKPDVTINNNNPTADALIARDWQNGNISNSNEFGLVFSTNFWGNPGKLEFFRYIGSTKHNIYSDDNTWYANRWYHVAAVIDDSLGMLMYINGVLQADTNGSTTHINNRYRK